MNKLSTAEIFSQPHNRIRLHLDGPSRPYDARNTAIRADLADVATAGQYFSPHYAQAMPYVCIDAATVVRGKPGSAEAAVTQLLRGESFHVLDVRAEWAWGYSTHDHYVGYAPLNALHPDSGVAATHHVLHPGALLFSGPDIKSPAICDLPGGALVHGAMDGNFLAIEGGYLHQCHVAPTGTVATDWVDVARTLLGMPYLWGGRGYKGIDCSGLVQTALGACGIAVARDTDQQAGTIGRPLTDGETPTRGDIVFFPGHVGIMTDPQNILHANAHWMRVVEEPLSDVMARLAPLHAEPITAKRRIIL